MKINNKKEYLVQCYANENWRNVADFDNKAMAKDLHLFKKKSEKHLRWRLIERVTKDKIVS